MEIKKLLQIGIIVRDVQSAVKHFEEDLGIGPWKVGAMNSDSMPGFHLDGKPGRLEMKNAFCHRFGMEIELIEPVSDSAYKTWLDEHGPGMHHISVITKDNFKDVVAEHKEKTGRDPWIWAKDTGAPEGQNLEFAYLQMNEELGMTVEVYPEHVEKFHESHIGGHEFEGK